MRDTYSDTVNIKLQILDIFIKPYFIMASLHKQSKLGIRVMFCFILCVYEKTVYKLNLFYY